MSQTKKECLYGKTLTQLQELCARESLPRFAAGQIARWLYVNRVEEIDQMTNLSLAARTRLKENYSLGLDAPLKESISQDGTKKYLFRTCEGQFIESAYIPDGDRATLCVSSQAGCRMGCRFCATGRQGLQHSLSPNEILNQILSIPESKKLTNLVFMGMGEPLDNTDNVLQTLDIITSSWGLGWSPTRITLSTAGVGRNLKRFLDESKVHLAISLHNPFHEEREQIMPIERAYPIHQIADILPAGHHHTLVIIIAGISVFGYPTCLGAACQQEYRQQCHHTNPIHYVPPQAACASSSDIAALSACKYSSRHRPVSFMSMEISTPT